MQPNDNELLSEEIESPVPSCANCGKTRVELIPPTGLCNDCREKFIKFPVPLAIKLFAVLVVGAMVFAAFRVPKNISAAVHYNRGRKEIRERHYLSAQRDLVLSLQYAPTYQKAQEYLVIASFYNNDFTKFGEVLNQLQGKEVKESDLYQEINELINKAANYYPPDTILQLYEKYGSWDSIPLDTVKHYAALHPGEVYYNYAYISSLVNLDEYVLSDSLLNGVLFIDKDFVPALNAKCAVKRELLDFDSAHFYSDRILYLNRESVYGVSSHARTYLKQGKNAEGLQLALRGFKIDPKEPYAGATLALAYHYNNMLSERDSLINKAMKDSVQAEYYTYINDIISGKEKFR